MLDNEINKNEVKVQVRRGMIGAHEGISSLPMECGSSTMSEMPRCPKGGLIVKVGHFIIKKKCVGNISNVLLAKYYCDTA